MCQGTLNLLTYVLPAVPLRQWVLSLPFELRVPLAYERNLMGAVVRIFADSVMGWYRRRLAEGVPEARGGVVTVIQRSSSDMKLNPHLHAIAVDGVYVPGPDGLGSTAKVAFGSLRWGARPRQSVETTGHPAAA